MSLKKLRAPHSLPVLLGLFLIVILTFLFMQTSVYAAVTLPSGFMQTRITGGLSKPTAFEVAPDGRIFVTQQTGELRVIKNGTLLAGSFLTVTTEITGERGLLGIAIDLISQRTSICTSITPFPEQLVRLHTIA